MFKPATLEKGILIVMKYFQVLFVAAIVVPSLGQRGNGGQPGGGRGGGGGGGSGRAKGGGGRGAAGKGVGGQTKPVPSKPKLIFGGFEPVGEGRGLRFPGGKRLINAPAMTNQVFIPSREEAKSRGYVQRKGKSKNNSSTRSV